MHTFKYTPIRATHCSLFGWSEEMKKSHHQIKSIRLQDQNNYSDTETTWGLVCCHSPVMDHFVYWRAWCRPNVWASATFAGLRLS